MVQIETDLPLPERSEPLLVHLRNRRSNLAKVMFGKGPDAETLTDILTIAARVPDHRKLAPWRFVTFQNDAREAFGQHIAKAFIQENPGMPQDRIDYEASRFLRAPLVIAVISAPTECPRGTPKWEQELSAGAVCYNLLLAAQGHGFAAQWLTEWYAYNADVLSALGVAEEERVAGFLYIGQTDTPPVERVRPEILLKTQAWSGEMTP